MVLSLAVSGSPLRSLASTLYMPVSVRSGWAACWRFAVGVELFGQGGDAGLLFGAGGGEGEFSKQVVLM
jgi:hypothetical protein